MVERIIWFDFLLENEKSKVIGGEGVHQDGLKFLCDGKSTGNITETSHIHQAILCTSNEVNVYIETECLAFYYSFQSVYILYFNRV